MGPSTFGVQKLGKISLFFIKKMLTFRPTFALGAELGAGWDPALSEQLIAANEERLRVRVG